MRKLLLLLSLVLLGVRSVAQSNETKEIQKVFNACIALRDATAANDMKKIQWTEKLIKYCRIDEFVALESADPDIPSLNGHFVFDAFLPDMPSRGQHQDGAIHTKTCFVKAGETSKQRFYASGHQELGVVAEAGGLITMKIHVTNEVGLDVRYDDRVDVKKGRSQRKVAFEMPGDCSNLVELEVLNRSNKDISFVVISN